MARRGERQTVRTLKRRVDLKDRAIPAQAGARRPTFAEVLASMPNVGLDADFERIDTNECGPSTSP
jgi:hypothetical protein